MHEVELTFYAAQSAASLGEQLQKAKNWHGAIDTVLTRQLGGHVNGVLSAKLFECENLATYGRAVERIRAWVKKAVKNYKVQAFTSADKDEQQILAAQVLTPEPHYSSDILPALTKAMDAMLQETFGIKQQEPELRTLAGESTQDAVATAQELQKLIRILQQVVVSAQTARTTLQARVKRAVNG